MRKVKDYILHLIYKMPLNYGNYYLYGVIDRIKKDCPDGFEMVLGDTIIDWEHADFPVLRKENKQFYYRFKVTRRGNPMGDYLYDDPGISADLVFSRVE